VFYFIDINKYKMLSSWPVDMLRLVLAQFCFKTGQLKRAKSK